MILFTIRIALQSLAIIVCATGYSRTRDRIYLWLTLSQTFPWLIPFHKLINKFLGLNYFTFLVGFLVYTGFLLVMPAVMIYGLAKSVSDGS